MELQNKIPIINIIFLFSDIFFGIFIILIYIKLNEAFKLLPIIFVFALLLALVHSQLPNE